MIDPARRLLHLLAMRIAMISTPFVPVPPPRYGGTELIVAELVTGLADAGHEVTLFATGDSRPRAGVSLRARFERAQLAAAIPTSSSITSASPSSRSSPTRAASTSCTRTCRRRCRSRAMIDAPMVYTVHHDDGADYAELQSLYRRSRAHFVAISARQRQLMQELADARVIHHGLDPARHRFGAGDGGYCAFLGRLAREKGPHVAIDVARARRRAHPPRRRAALARPRILRARAARARWRCAGVSAVGEVGGAHKRELLADARALLFPVDWEEPFGLVMIEAMLSGTPVLAFDARLGARDRRGGRDRLHLSRRRRDGGAAARASRSVRSRGAAGGARSSAGRRRAWCATTWPCTRRCKRGWVMSEQPRLLPEIVRAAESALGAADVGRDRAAGVVARQHLLRARRGAATSRRRARATSACSTTTRATCRISSCRVGRAAGGAVVGDVRARRRRRSI